MILRGAFLDVRRPSSKHGVPDPYLFLSLGAVTLVNKQMQKVGASEKKTPRVSN